MVFFVTHCKPLKFASTWDNIFWLDNFLTVDTTRIKPYPFKRRVFSYKKRFLPVSTSTVDNTSMNPSLFRKNILLVFSESIWAKDKSNTNFCILIARAFRWANQIFTPTISTADINKTRIWATHLTDDKTFLLLRNFEKFFQPIMFI